MTEIELSDITIGDRVRYRVGREPEGWGLVKFLRPRANFPVEMTSELSGLAGLLRLNEILEVVKE